VDVQDARAVIENFADQQIGLADASMVVLAGRYRSRAIATLDRRHFSVLRTLDGHAFEILP
jgi:predicted nucleic acid-binding protein